ncbi:hypothetical protein ATE67_12985 [Sphingopyxis sp. H050]|jgi:PEP-CTERM motif|uniref:PEPxxWA-CTERM sorting domain-containing protein n=1 Tax=Sphingopyxis sp. H050 TaxID=1759072 RepID=UPI00073673D6|nr:PEPxxWA-CTERM sorting domain-containing protein [Sphingopyxis sp. H050]KTE19570.1 hypothetical protein ATE67_12985 [Sphingopyxis sp. H050]
MSAISKFGIAAAVAISALSTVPAEAALNLGATDCSLADISPAASACRGWYTGNLNNGSPADKADSLAALNLLLGTSNPGPLTWLEDLTDLSGNTVDFTTALYGDTVVSFHVGAAKGEDNGVGYQATAFFRFDAGNLAGGLNSFTLNRDGLSNARLYYTGRPVTSPVPEPATWAMMLFGFGVVGAGMRVRRRNTHLRLA